MQSRTAEGKHTARFIILRKNSNDDKFVRSSSFPNFYATREEAQNVLAARDSSFVGVEYKIRQK